LGYPKAVVQELGLAGRIVGDCYTTYNIIHPPEDPDDFELEMHAVFAELEEPLPIPGLLVSAWNAGLTSGHVALVADDDEPDTNNTPTHGNRTTAHAPPPIQHQQPILKTIM
jgi:hypothetical protein